VGSIGKTMRFERENQFIAWLKQQPEPGPAFSFLPGSRYPLNISVERKPNRLIVTEVRCNG
jgi:hypothetical protein